MHWLWCSGQVGTKVKCHVKSDMDLREFNYFRNVKHYIIAGCTAIIVFREDLT